MCLRSHIIMKSLISAKSATSRPTIFRRSMLAVSAALVLAAGSAGAEVNRIKGNPNALILDGVRISDDMEVFYLSGQLASPVDAKKPMADVKSVEEMGDSKAQTVSVLSKIKGLLEAQGYKMSDLIKLTLFVAADPKTGKMDFAGVNDGFKMFFGTAENPNTVARSTFQVAALVGPYYLIEIEAIAAKKKGSTLGAATIQRFKVPLDTQDDNKEAEQSDPAKASTAPGYRPPVRQKRGSLVYYANGNSRRG
jgi:2-iminobutanoate/2-iminopropanoate deaminase